MPPCSLAARESKPWTLRLFDAAPVAPVWVGVGLATGLVGLFLASELALDRFRLLAAGGDFTWLRHDFRIALVLLVMLAYVPTAWTYALRGVRRTLVELRPALLCSDDEFRSLLESVGHLDRRVLRSVALVGLAAGVLAPVVADQSWEVYRLDVIVPEPTWHRVAAPLLGWLLLSFFYAIVTESRRLSRVGRDRVRVDLLDRGPLVAFARQGLRNALLTVGFLSLVALLLLDLTVAPGFVWILLTLLGLSGLLAGVGLVLPVRGVRQSIRKTKQAELAWIASELARARDRLAAVPREAAPPASGLADLVAYRSLIAAVPEWPFDPPTLARFGLYLAIPLASWLGGAVVERLLDAALG